MSRSTGEAISTLDVRTAVGLLLVASSSATRYFLRLEPGDGPFLGQLLRHTGPGSSTLGGDDRWVALQTVHRADEHAGGVTWTPDVVSVGHRHRYGLRPTRYSDAAWWVQRRVTAITRLDRLPSGVVSA